MPPGRPESRSSARSSPATRAGFEVAIGGPGGPRAFCPVSQIDVGRHDEPGLLEFVNQSFDFRVIEYAEDGRRVVVSRAALMRDAMEKSLGEIRDKIVLGAVLTGKVRSITDFGAFVDLGGVDGLVHVTEISRRRVAHAKDALTVGQEVSVKVTKVENEGKRISLSMKELEKDPWEGLAQRIPPGTAFTKPVARHAEFGIFIEIEPGIDGLVHVSQLPPGVDLKDPSVAAGQEVSGWVREVDEEHRRLSLSLREVSTSDPWEGLADEDARGLGRRGTGRERRGVRSLRAARDRPHRPHPELRDGPPARDAGHEAVRSRAEGRSQGDRSRRPAAAHLPLGEGRRRGGRARRDPQVPRGLGQAREERAGPPDELRRLAHGGAHPAEQGGEVGPLSAIGPSGPQFPVTSVPPAPSRGDFS